MVQVVLNLFAPVQLILRQRLVLVDAVEAQKLEHRVHLVVFNQRLVLLVSQEHTIY
jgi:hypothetical protein